MIINPINNGYEQQSHRPNINWQKEEGWLLVDETTSEGKQLAEKIVNNYPNFEIVSNNGEVEDIVLNELIQVTCPDETNINEVINIETTLETENIEAELVIDGEVQDKQVLPHTWQVEFEDEGEYKIEVITQRHGKFSKEVVVYEN